MKQHVIIVAGGKGARMGSEVPKQFLLLCRYPVLMHTIETFYRSGEMEIVVVLPESQQAYWKTLCKQYDFKIPHQTVNGGETRFHSVKKGLELIPESVIVGIHDGVRPLVSPATITACYDAAATDGSAFPVVPVIDTLRKKIPGGSIWVDRSEYCQVQTPQVFRSELIKKAYLQPFSDQFTDDISVLESFGLKGTEVAGSRENIKITTTFDLELAETILRKNT